MSKQIYCFQTLKDFCNDDVAWFLPTGRANKIIWKSREERQEEMKKNHPLLHAFMKRHERMAK